MSEQRPAGRKRNVTGSAQGGARRGEGLGTGPVGAKEGQAGRPGGADQRVSGQGHMPGARPRSQVNPGAQGGYRRGSGLGTGPVGSGSGSSQGQKGTLSGLGSLLGGAAGSGSSGSGSSGSSGGKGGLSLIVILLVLLLGGGGGMLSGLFGGGDTTTVDNTQTYNNSYTSTYDNSYNNSSTSTNGGSYGNTVTTQTSGAGTSASSSMAGDLLSSLLGGSGSPFSLLGGGATSVASGYSTPVVNADSLSINRNVAAGSRAKYTQLRGNGQDTVTLMVYMCGTDLESRSAMASRDLQEMARATYGDNVRVIIYTGGCKKWQISSISSQVNQIYRVRNGNLERLVENDGNKSMTDPATLSAFIRYCAKNYPATRYQLILWDHGGGSVSGYGYDEKNTRAGSMSLAGLNTALQDGGVKFDVIGFDACLMATVENAMMVSRYADYLLASEETEPGVGWYYTDWLTALGNNTSISTLDLGKVLCDTFVSACQTQARGQATTLSLVDLAELEHTIPEQLSAFSKSISSLIRQKDYKAVSDARSGSREFAASTRIDQVDLTDLALKLDTNESKALAAALRSAVKYNRCGSMTGAYGLSIYFPYQKASSVDKAVSTYRAIGMDDSYAECIRAFASVEMSGQAALGGYSSPVQTLSGSSASSFGSDMIGQLLGSFLGGDFGGLGGLSSSNTGFLSGRVLSDEELTTYIAGNALDGSALTWTKAADGSRVLSLPASQWGLVHSVDLNAFLDDGHGWIDLGLDNVFSVSESGDLIPDTAGAWVTLNGQVCAYYHDKDTEDAYLGYIPVLINGQRAELLVSFDTEGYGSVTGARTVYSDETDTVAKNEFALNPGDTIDLLCDYYTYDNQYQDSYRFGEPITVGESGLASLTVSDGTLDPEKLRLCYRLTDIYNRAYWTEVYGL